MNIKNNWFIQFSTIVLSLGGFSAALFYVASQTPDGEFVSQDNSQTKNSKSFDLENKQIIRAEAIPVETFESKTSDFESMKKLYKQKLASGKMKDGVDVYLTTDNNHKPCYVSGKDLISYSGKKIPFNFVPPELRCENINISDVNNEAVVVIDSLNYLLNETAKYPLGYAFKINGEGLSGVLKNCGEFWSDNCKTPTQAKIIVSNKSPVDLPTPRSVNSVLLTSKLPSSFLNGSTNIWPKNNKFFLWKRVPFKSKLAVNGVADGQYVETTKEAYEKAYDVAIVLKEGKVLVKNKPGNDSFCLLNEDGFPVNSKGDVLPTAKFPETLDCKNAESDDGKILASKLSEFILWKNAPVGYQIITRDLTPNRAVNLENCGNYWSDSCKNPQNETLVVAKTRTFAPAKRSKNRNVYTVELGEAKTNIGGIKTNSGLYFWEDVVTPTAVNGLSDITTCGYSSNCYTDKVAKAARYAKASNKQYIQYKENDNGIGLWSSMDNQYILSPVNNMRWSTIKQPHLIDGVSKDGKFYHISKELKTFEEASKECSGYGMEIPEISDTDIGNRNGINTQEWAWVLSKESFAEYAVWRKGTLSRDGILNKNKVICVSKD